MTRALLKLTIRPLYQTLSSEALTNIVIGLAKSGSIEKRLYCKIQLLLQPNLALEEHYNTGYCSTRSRQLEEAIPSYKKI